MQILQQEDLNFLLTNRIPRRWLTLLMGRLSRIERPWFAAAAISVWRLFSDLDLSEARTDRFNSLHACFTRELKAGARRIDADPALLASPCDALVGACGTVEAGMVLQAKGFPYRLADLLGAADLVDYYRRGTFATLRLTSTMYHRFHAPYDCRVERVSYISGDTWNVNPIALKRVERLFCKNERAVIRCRLPSGALLTLVPVAAILVASVRLKFLDVRLHLDYRGPNVIPCDVAVRKGEELGWFEHGSTIIVFAPEGTSLVAGLGEGGRLRMGEALMRLPFDAVPANALETPTSATSAHTLNPLHDSLFEKSGSRASGGCALYNAAAAVQMAGSRGASHRQGSVSMDNDIEVLERMYNCFNARDVDGVLGALTDDVAWANGMDGGHVHGREGVRDYWARQWAIVRPHVEPVSFDRAPDGSIVVEVRQSVRDLQGRPLQDQTHGLRDKAVGHVFRFQDGKVTRFDIRDAS
jgi:phosphatidylserine decarboxylase